MLLLAKAQMTPEAVMGMTPDLPTTAALLKHWKELSCGGNDKNGENGNEPYWTDLFRFAYASAEK